MPTRAEWAARPLEQRLDRLRRTADDLATAIRGRSEAELGRRPDAANWSATEILCHLRDIEELAMTRYRLMLAMDEPKVMVAGAAMPDPAQWGLRDGELAIDPERWAEERQYARCDPAAAVAAFTRRRREALDLFARLTADQRRRGCQHPRFGRVTFADWAGLMAAHDDNHLAQLERVLEGRA
jgi:hypothetical protein